MSTAGRDYGVLHDDDGGRLVDVDSSEIDVFWVVVQDSPPMIPQRISV